jgi:DNA gyrase subunit A
MSLCNKPYIFTLTESGLGKCSDLEEYAAQGRGGTGLIAHKITNKTGAVISANTVSAIDDILIATAQGLMIRIKASDISIMGRSTSGVKLLTLNEGDSIASVSICQRNDEDKEAEE